LEFTDGELQSAWPELELLARPARERRRLDPTLFSALIVALCARAPLSVRQLSVLLRRSEAYVGDAIRPLVATGRIGFLYPDQPKHPRQRYVAASSPDEEAPDEEAPDEEGRHEEARDDEAFGDEKPAIHDEHDASGTEYLPEAAHAREPHRAPEFVEAHVERVARHERRRSHRPAADRHTQLLTVEATPPRGWGSPAVSVFVAVLLGVVLAFAARHRWLVIAVVGSLVFGCIHVLTKSRQFAEFQQHAYTRGRDPTSALEVSLFVLIKATFSFVETAIVVLLVTSLMPRGQ
jgi:hypothetical protein